MTPQFQNKDAICARLIALGFAKNERIRMYGEEFDLTSDPVADESGFAIEAVSRTSGNARKLRIPISVLRTIAAYLERSSLNAA
jgi:hypothetical protein